MTALALDPGSIGAGSAGLVVIVLLIVATILLIRSMQRHLRRVPRRFGDRENDGR